MCVCVCVCACYNNIALSKLEKWFPLQGERAHSLKCFVCTIRGWIFQKQNRKEEEMEQQQTCQFTQSYTGFCRILATQSRSISIYGSYGSYFTIP